MNFTGKLKQASHFQLQTSGGAVFSGTPPGEPPRFSVQVFPHKASFGSAVQNPAQLAHISSKKRHRIRRSSQLHQLAQRGKSLPRPVKNGP
jgi:hypothetical protein